MDFFQIAAKSKRPSYITASWENVKAQFAKDIVTNL
jgi:hypothetical protein